MAGFEVTLHGRFSGDPRGRNGRGRWGSRRRKENSETKPGNAPVCCLKGDSPLKRGHSLSIPSQNRTPPGWLPSWKVPGHARWIWPTRLSLLRRLKTRELRRVFMLDSDFTIYRANDKETFDVIPLQSMAELLRPETQRLPKERVPSSRCH
jgi:hypothetical protein